MIPILLNIIWSVWNEIFLELFCIISPYRNFFHSNINNNNNGPKFDNVEDSSMARRKFLNMILDSSFAQYRFRWMQQRGHWICNVVCVVISESEPVLRNVCKQDWYLAYQTDEMDGNIFWQFLHRIELITSEQVGHPMFRDCSSWRIRIQEVIFETIYDRLLYFVYVGTK